MRYFPHISLIVVLLFLVSCREDSTEIMRNIELLKAGGADDYTVAYTYATYLSTTRNIQAEKAIPIINDLISMGYPTVARYCINNLQRNGIHSADLLALRGLCFQLELQPDLAESDMEAARRMDPANEKIQALINNSRQQYQDAEDLPLHETLFQKGILFIQNQNYDSAMYLINQAMAMIDKPEYEVYLRRLEQISEGNRMIFSNPGNYRAYMLKSQGLSALKQFGEAQNTLDAGLIASPENLNLILAKALVWVQEGETETARIYLWEQEQQGLKINPEVKQKILQPQNQSYR